MKGGYTGGVIFFSRRTGLIAWLRDCANRCREESCPAEVLLPKKWRKKFAFLSRHVGRPGKVSLDHASISKLYQWAKTNIKCSNRKKACERPPSVHTTASNITHSAAHCRSIFFSIDEFREDCLGSSHGQRYLLLSKKWWLSVRFMMAMGLDLAGPPKIAHRKWTCPFFLSCSTLTCTI